MATSWGGVTAQLIEVIKISAESARYFTRCNLFDSLFALYTAFLPGGGGDLYVALDLADFGLGDNRSSVCLVALVFYNLEFKKQTQEGEGGGSESPRASFHFQ